MQPWQRRALRTLAWSTGLGLVILGVGGRLAMAAIQVRQGGSSSWSWGGSMTVVFLGAVSGLGGGVIALATRALAMRLSPSARWMRWALYALLLLLVTMRGLRGAPPTAAWYFYSLVALFGVALALIDRERHPTA